MDLKLSRLIYLAGVRFLLRQILKMMCLSEVLFIILYVVQQRLAALPNFANKEEALRSADCFREILALNYAPGVAAGA